MVCFAEPLEMDDLPLPQEPDGIVDVRVIAQAQDIVVGKAGLLLRRQVLRQVGDHVAGDLNRSGAPRKAGGCGGVDPCGVVHKVGVEPRSADLLFREISGQLVDNGPDHLQVAELFRTQRSIGNVPLPRNARTAAIYGL